jgi:inorganic pyrophosphatase
MAFDFELGLLRMTKELPAGFEFPFHFGAVPCTLGGDGDPLDLILFGCENPAAGSLVASRTLGVLEALVRHKGKSERNDRLIAVASESRAHRSMRSIRDLPAETRKEIQSFFEDYNARGGKRFEVLGWYGPQRAEKLLRSARTHYIRSRNGAEERGRSFSDYVRALRD